MMNSRATRVSIGCWIVIYLSLCSVKAGAFCQNCFYGSDFCDPISKRCTYGCQDGYKGKQCLTQCITKGCKHCDDQIYGIEQCASCIQSGKYGPLCNLRCSANCKRYVVNDDDTCDHFGNCIYGCVAPYMGHKCTEQNCPFDNCVQCSLLHNKRVYCHQCVNGYYWVGLPTVQRCVPCTSHCLYGITDCDVTTGLCKSGQCSSGYVGSACNIPCDIEHCTVCEDNNGRLICVTCDQGFFPSLSTSRRRCVACKSDCR